MRRVGWLTFSGPMIEALLNTRPGVWPAEPINKKEPFKFQTRRVIDVERCKVPSTPKYPVKVFPLPPVPTYCYCPYGAIGSRLYVREKWKCAWNMAHGHGILYEDGQFRCFNGCCNNLRNKKVFGGPSQPGYDWIAAHYGNDHRIEPWRSSRHMPRWASRLEVELRGIRVEPLQAITEADAVAEGIFSVRGTNGFSWNKFTVFNTAVKAYEHMWQSINGKTNPWDKKPWVWALDIMRVR